MMTLLWHTCNDKVSNNILLPNYSVIWIIYNTYNPNVSKKLIDIPMTPVPYFK